MLVVGRLDHGWLFLVVGQSQVVLVAQQEEIFGNNHGRGGALHKQGSHSRRRLWSAVSEHGRWQLHVLFGFSAERTSSRLARPTTTVARAAQTPRGRQRARRALGALCMCTCCPWCGRCGGVHLSRAPVAPLTTPLTPSADKLIPQFKKTSAFRLCRRNYFYMKLRDFCISELATTLSGVFVYFNLPIYIF